MFNLAVAALLRGFRTSDTQRIAVGSLLLLGALYRRGRRKGALIAAYDLREGDEMTVRVPGGRGTGR